MKGKQKTCKWGPDDTAIDPTKWKRGGCGRGYASLVTVQGWLFCPYCGKRIEVVR